MYIKNERNPSMKNGNAMILLPKEKNSIIIQMEFAIIQNNTDRLTQNSLTPRVIYRIQMDAINVGAIIHVPRNLNSIIQLMSFISQKPTCMFSINRVESVFSSIILENKIIKSELLYLYNFHLKFYGDKITSLYICYMSSMISKWLMRMDKILLFFISCIFISLFFRGHAVESMFIIGFTAFSLIILLRENSEISKDKFYWAWILYFSIMIVSGIWAVDTHLYMSKIRIKSAILALPFCFMVLPSMHLKSFEIFAKILVSVVLCSLIYVLANFLLNQGEILRYMKQGHPVPVPFRSHIRYSILLNFTLLISIFHADKYRKINETKKFVSWLIICSLLFFAIQFLAVKIGVLISILILFIFAFYKIISKKLYFKGFLFIVVAIGLVSILVMNLPTLRNKFDYFRYDIARFLSKDTQNYSDGERIVSILKGINVIKTNPWLGVGEGNVARYIGANDVLDAKLPHNQFVITWAQNGILGILILSSIFVLGGFYAYKNKNWMSMTYLIAMFLALSVEPMLETQLGVALFTLPLLLLHSLKLEE